jgi:hypothetical protein
MTIKDGGPAFPTRSYDLERDVWVREEGMTLRDHFAGLAMQGLLACDLDCSPKQVPGIAASAYILADAMLKAREAETQQEKLLAGYEMGHLQAIAEKARRMNGRGE